MRTAIVKLKKVLCENAAKSRKLQEQIEALTWKEGSLSEVQRIRSQRDKLGRRIAGKRALKPYRRPETGPERDQLWQEKHRIGAETRRVLLAYGLICGRPYQSIENSYTNETSKPSAYTILRTLEKVLALGDWLKGDAIPVASKEAA